MTDRTGTTTSAFSRFLRTETLGGAVLLAAAFVALLWANSPWAHSYDTLSDLHLGVGSILGHPIHMNLSLSEWAQDGLLSVFFFVAGLELKRELVIGELSTVKSATLPVVSAVGGVVAPALIALGIGWGAPHIGSAWAIPIATDIAFALGILALTGTRLPSGARVFLLGLAVVDDLIAIIVIAVVFAHGIDIVAIVVAAVCCLGWWFAQRRRVTTALVYVPLALVTWVCVLQSGIHATVAGVVLGLLTRVRPDADEDEGPAERMAHRIQPLSALVCVPAFALMASGVRVDSGTLRSIFTDRVALAVVVGLLVGKVVGIFGASSAAVALGVAERPDGLHTRDMLALSVLGAIGFTVSLLVADLSLAGDDAQLVKAAVLGTSVVAAILGSVLLIHRSRVHGAQ